MATRFQRVRWAACAWASISMASLASGAPPAAATINEGLRALSANSTVRVVWLEDAHDTSADPFGDAASYRLVGWDSAQPAAGRLLELRGNWARPLMAPDGQSVIFTDRGRTMRDRKEFFDPVMMTLDWGGGALRVLGKGHAVDVRRDPVAGVDWVYFIDDVAGSEAFTISGNTLGRFPLAHPDRREVVWNRATMAVDNLQVSRDGTKFIGLFPGREAALVDVPSGRWHKLETGCWPSLAPDDSYVAWVFDGPHRHVRMFDVRSDREWRVNLSIPRDIGGAETFHPRWSNHPRILAFTGPYAVPKTEGRARVNQVRLGARAAEVFVASLSPALDRLEHFVRVTYNDVGDFFPDVWVEGGEGELAGKFPQQPALGFAQAENGQSSSSTDTAVFRWRGQKKDNVVASSTPAGSSRACLAEARGIGRLSAHHGLWLDGGWFEADGASSSALARAVPDQGELSVAFTITEWAEAPLDSRAVIVAAGRGGEKPHFVLLRRGDRFEGLVVPPSGGEVISLGGVERPLTPGRAVALAVTMGRSGALWHVNGEVVSEPTPVPAEVFNSWPGDAHLFFGTGSPPEGGWHGNLEEVSLHPKVLNPAEVRELAIEAAKVTAGRTWPEPVVATARLVSATEPDLEKLDTYRRMLVDHVYEVTQASPGLPRRISVLHWAVLDGVRVSGIPREEGREYNLVLDPYDRRPELGSELTDISSDDYELPMFLDVATPARPAQ